MTLDSQIRDRLHSAVDDTTAPPAFADVVLRGGRARRRRRYGTCVAVVAVAMAGGAWILVPDPPVARDAPVASDGVRTHEAALEWARSLPEGPVPELPYFGEGGLHAGDRVVPLPGTVSRVVAPRAVEGGWLVSVGDDHRRLEPAVLTPEGDLRPLPVHEIPGDAIHNQMAVSSDGARVAYGHRVVHVATLETTEIPHVPETTSSQGYATDLRMIGFTDEGLVYEGAPFDEGIGTHWLLADDGSTTRIDPPADIHVPQGSPAGIAVGFDYNADETDTCVTTYDLADAAWVEQPTHCMGQYLGEALDISPGGRWLLTDDLPEVWDLRDGGFDAVDVPRDVLVDWREEWMGKAGWESPDTFLVPVADRWFAWEAPEPFDQHVQIVRCSMPTGTCERAGEEQTLRVNGGVNTLGSPDIAFSSY